MNILYFHQYFKTPLEPGGTRSYWIAQELRKRGHKITMITSSSKFSLATHKVNIDGIDVVYIKEEYSQEMSILRRAKAFFNFMIKSTILALKESKDVDLVIATSTPLTVGMPALMLKWFKKIPYIFEVRDLWPEVPIQMGAFKNSLVINVTRLFEKTIYRNACHVVALSPGMRDGIVKYVSKDKTSMISNMSKKDEFWIREKNYDMMDAMCLKRDTFKIVHFGSLGIANGAHVIIESAGLLANDESVEFIFVGGGSTESSLKDNVERLGLKNVKFFPKCPMKEISEIVNFCDISIVSFLDLPILYTNSPNKLFDSLSAGKPIIVNSAGWTKEMVETNECGYYVSPNDPQDLVNKIKILQIDIELRNKMAKNSRLLAETKFDKSILCTQFADLVDKCYKI